MGHEHSHASGRAEDRARLRIVLGGTVAVMVLEVVGALTTGSLALLADAGHMASDAAALGLTLFAMHIAACGGILPAKAPCFERARASAIVYAERDISAFPTLDWPHWAADRPTIGSRIARGDPLCTVFACAAGGTEARALAERRIAMILALTIVDLP